jgi:inner membrane protein YidH
MADQTLDTAPKLDTSTRLAYDRTRLAYERTMMAWVRTSASLITFGFTIYKFFQIEAEKVGEHNRLIGPRGFALLLVSIGLISLLLATLEYRQNIQIMKAQYPGVPRSLAMIVAGLVSVLGILALILMLFRQ